MLIRLRYHASQLLTINAAGLPIASHEGRQTSLLVMQLETAFEPLATIAENLKK